MGDVVVFNSCVIAFRQHIAVNHWCERQAVHSPAFQGIHEKHYLSLKDAFHWKRPQFLQTFRASAGYKPFTRPLRIRQGLVGKKGKVIPAATL